MTPGGFTLIRRHSLFCLLVFLAYLLLPLAHRWHLASHAPRCSCWPAVTGDTATGGLISRPPDTGESRHRHHDPSTCPLCQAALGPDKLALAPAAPLAPAAQWAEDFSPPEPAAVLSASYYFLAPSRAPPSTS